MLAAGTEKEQELCSSINSWHYKSQLDRSPLHIVFLRAPFRQQFPMSGSSLSTNIFQVHKHSCNCFGGLALQLVDPCISLTWKYSPHYFQLKQKPKNLHDILLLSQQSNSPPSSLLLHSHFSQPDQCPLYFDNLWPNVQGQHLLIHFKRRLNRWKRLYECTLDLHQSFLWCNTGK